MSPLFGRTQYCFGAVVLTLKQMRFLDGLLSFRSAVTTSVNGPKKCNYISRKWCFVFRAISSVLLMCLLRSEADKKRDIMQF